MQSNKFESKVRFSLEHVFKKFQPMVRKSILSFSLFLSSFLPLSPSVEMGEEGRKKISHQISGLFLQFILSPKHLYLFISLSLSLFVDIYILLVSSE